MSYRPLGDNWWCARAKLRGGRKYYGAYPGGFAERARSLLGVGVEDPVLHVCGGMARFYPYHNPGAAFGLYDETLDLDPATEPDHLRDARNPFPTNSRGFGSFRGFLIDPPYTQADAAKYQPGAEAFPSAELLLRRGLEASRPGGRVGILHYIVPRPPAKIKTRFVAAVSVWVGFNNRVRA